MTPNEDAPRAAPPPARRFDELLTELRGRYEEVVRRQGWLETTSEITSRLLAGAEPGAVLDLLAERVRGIAGADIAIIEVPVPGGRLEIVAASGEGAQGLRGRTVLAEGTLGGEVLLSGKARSVDDASAIRALHGESVIEFDPSAALVVPIGGDRIRGVIALAGRSGFDETTVRIVSDLADQAAIAMEMAERRADSERLSIYAEQDRIGRDLQEQAIQRLFACSLALQGVLEIAEKPVLVRRLTQVVTDLDETIKVIRSTVFALREHSPRVGAEPTDR